MGEIMRKVYPFEVKEVAERTLQFTGSTEEMDRDGEVILASGWDLKNYKANPVFMWAHRYDQPPIGKATRVWVSKDNRLKFDIEFADAETYEFADTIYKLYKGGFLKATSVGFMPGEWDDGDGEKAPKRTYTKQELLELSAVPVPSNPTALISGEEAMAEGIDMGILVKAFEAAIQKPEETDDYIRLPVSGEEGKHDGHKIRTMDIDKDKGVKALYCVDCKKVITYLFAKDEDWTMESAREWVDEHSKGAKPVSQGEIKDEFDYVRSLIEQGDLSDENKELAWDIAREVMRLPGSDIPVDIQEKVGAVLSQKNKEGLKQAQDLIQRVLDSAQTQDDEKSVLEQPDEGETETMSFADAVEIATNRALDRLGISK